MATKIRYIKKNELNKLISFDKQEYGAGHILTNKIYLNWQFGSLPRENRYYTILGLFDSKENLLGVLGLTFLDYNFFGQKLKCTSYANLLIKKEYRNLGYGYLLMNEANTFNALSVDHGINKEARKLFEGMGWWQKDLERYIFILDPIKTKKLIGKKDITIKPSKFKKITEKSKLDFDFVEIKKPNKKLDEFWAGVKSKYCITVERSRGYLNWRYFYHPLINYQCFIVKKNQKIKSFIVLRIEKPLNFQVARIIDFISEDEAEQFSLLKIVEFCKLTKIDFIDYFFSGQFHLANLKKTGFINGVKKPYSYLPKLLNPIVREKDSGINVAIKIADKKLKRKLRRDVFDYWYTTKGGGDQDRPN